MSFDTAYPPRTCHEDGPVRLARVPICRVHDSAGDDEHSAPYQELIVYGRR